MGTILKSIDTVYNGYKFRSRLEARWAVFFDELGIEWKYEEEGYEINGQHYLPDFELYLPEIFFLDINNPSAKQKVFFEVKGKYDLPENVIEKLAAFVGEVPIILAYGDPADMQLAYFVHDLKTGLRSCICEHADKIHVGYSCGKRVVLTTNPTFDNPSIKELADNYPQFITERITQAATKARQTRFEHGKKPVVVSASIKQPPSTKVLPGHAVQDHIEKSVERLLNSPSRLSQLYDIGLTDEGINKSKIGITGKVNFIIPFYSNNHLDGLVDTDIHGDNVFFINRLTPHFYPGYKQTEIDKPFVIVSNIFLSILINQEIEGVNGMAIADVRDKGNNYDLFVWLVMYGLSLNQKMLFAISNDSQNRREQLLNDIYRRHFCQSCDVIHIQNNLDISTIKQKIMEYTNE